MKIKEIEAELVTCGDVLRWAVEGIIAHYDGDRKVFVFDQPMDMATLFARQMPARGFHVKDLMGAGD